MSDEPDDLDRRLAQIGKPSAVAAPDPGSSLLGLGLLALFVIGGIVTCSMSGGSDDAAPARSTARAIVGTPAQNAAWEAEMQLRVRRALRDPSSAEFSGTRTYHGGGVPVVCGRVNSRNGFGGMSGPQRFIASGAVIALEEQMADGEIEEVWAKFCR